MFTTDQHDHLWYPGSPWGYIPAWSAIDTDLVLRAAGVSCIFLLLCALGRYAFVHKPAHKDGFWYYIWVAAYTASVELLSLIDQSIRSAQAHHMGFIGMLAVYILLCNWSVLIGVHEPTADYNMTLALALITFLWVQKEAIQAHGLKGYLGEFAKMPFKLRLNRVLDLLKLPFLILGNIIVSLISIPLELVGKLSQVLSLSFRLFGNILAGSVIWGLWKSLGSSYIGVRLLGLLGINLILLGFFGVFEGLIQAFVFTMLATTYLGIALGTGEHTS